MIRKGLLFSIPVLVAMFALSVWAYSGASPDVEYPVHWGLSGQPDRYGHALEAFFVLPFVALAVTAVFTFVPLLDPRGENIRRSAPFYLTTWAAVLLFMGVLHGAMTLSAMGLYDPDHTQLPRLMASGVGLLLLVMGNVLGKARPNWFAGVRTPWTLSSDLAWDKTHRLAGRLFVVVGAAGAVAAWLAPISWTLPLLVGGSLGTTLISVIYSWGVWRTAPDRRTGAQAVDR